MKYPTKIIFITLIMPGLFFCLLSKKAFANDDSKIKVTGKVLADGRPLQGATIVIEGSNKGAISESDGSFVLEVEKEKPCRLQIVSVGYSVKTIDFSPQAYDRDKGLIIRLTEEANNLDAVTVSSSSRKSGSVSAVYLMQKNGNGISDGISSDIIKKSPDKNVGDVLKRISGASVQDDKFVIIRGLNERYNTAMINNAILPSTEPDKRAFAFDIIPSGIVDNLVIYKTASPDLPGDFAGGAIKITTKEFPTAKLSELSFSAGYNSLTTFQKFEKGYGRSSYGWLSFPGNTYALPDDYQWNSGSGFINLPSDEKLRITKEFSNGFGYQPANKSLPDFNLSYTGGDSRFFSNNRKLGYIYYLGYSNSRSVAEWDVTYFQANQDSIKNYKTNNYDQHNALTGLLNLTYSYNSSKISWKNLYNNELSQTVGVREGILLENKPDIIPVVSSSSDVVQSGIFSSVLEGVHRLPGSWNIEWNGSFARTLHNEPDQRILTFNENRNDHNYYLTLSNENSPNIQNAGRIYNKMYENIYGANIDITKEFEWGGQNQQLKFGTANYYRDRSLEVDALGYGTIPSNGANIPLLTNGNPYGIFTPENIDQYQLTLANISSYSADYTGTALLNAGYLLLNNRFNNKLKLTWGARIEQYHQKIKSENIKDVDARNVDLLPSFILTYALNDKANIRIAGSQSVNRPEFREIAETRAYDYKNDYNYQGNPDLKRSRNSNADLRYEWFPSTGEIISASLFYKYFKDPIEQVNNGNNIISHDNADYSSIYGAEVEIRKKLDFLNAAFLNNLTVYANGAYIKGNVKFADKLTSTLMQGQSPYVINGGLTYTPRSDDFAVNLIYNRIGPRVVFRSRGGDGLDTYEKPRDVLDAQLSKKLFRKKLEIKLTLSDILAQSTVWYQKFDPDPSSIHYNSSTDKINRLIKLGTTTSVSFKYNF